MKIPLPQCLAHTACWHHAFLPNVADHTCMGPEPYAGDVNPAGDPEGSAHGGGGGAGSATLMVKSLMNGPDRLRSLPLFFVYLLSFFLFFLFSLLLISRIALTWRHRHTQHSGSLAELTPNSVKFQEGGRNCHPVRTSPPALPGDTPWDAHSSS